MERNTIKTTASVQRLQFMIGSGLVATREVDAVAAEIALTVLTWAGARDICVELP